LQALHGSTHVKTPGTDRYIAAGALLLLVLGCVLVLRPFATALAWAGILVMTGWAPFVRLERALGMGRLLPAALATLSIALLVLVPVIAVAIGLSVNLAQLGVAVKALLDQGLPAAPGWLGDLPLIGVWLEQYWAQYVHDGHRLVAEIRRWGPALQNFALSAGEVVTDGVLDVALSVFLAFFLFQRGEAIAARIRIALEHVSGERAATLIDLIHRTVAGVVYGVLGTALAQGVLATIGFALAGVPGAVLLGTATFFLSVVPIGPPMIWGGAAIWLFSAGRPGWALFVALWGLLIVSTVDNLIKPLIISRGARLPFPVVFLGVVGGVLAFGVIGAFLGPALLAVGYRLATEWTAPGEPPATPGPAQR
jgi:predicted PurR-regulated permease PerM